MEVAVGVYEKTKEFFGSDGAPHRILDQGTWIDTGWLEWKLPSIELEPPKLSPTLTEAFEEVSRRISGENFDTKAGYLNQKKYQTRVMEVFEQIKTPEIQNDFDIIQPKLIAFNKNHSQWLRTRKSTLKKVRAILQHDPVIAYWAGTEWEGNILDTIVVASITDQFEILQMERTNGVNYGILNHNVISGMKFLDTTYGIDITGAGMDGLDFVLQRIPKGKEARELGKRLLQFCPDLYEAPKSFPKGKVSLWWD